MRILATPDHQDLTAHLARALQRIIPLAERCCMQVRRIKAGCRLYPAVKCSSKGKMATETDAQTSNCPCRVRSVREVINDGAGIRVVGLDSFSVLQLVSSIRAGLVISENSASGLEFVVNLWAGDDVPVTSEKGRHPADWRRDLEDLRIQNKCRESASGFRSQDVRSHGAGRRIERYCLTINNRHRDSIGRSTRLPLRESCSLALRLSEEELLRAKLLDGVSKLGSLFKLELLCGLTHVGLKLADVDIQFLLR